VGADPDTRAQEPPSDRRTALGVAAPGARVVVADGDAPRRAALLDELTQRMPERTRFAEASSIAQALELAGDSRMVVIGGPVQGASASLLARALASRHPEVHVLDLSTSARSGRQRG
jgi:hypothetical protein